MRNQMESVIIFEINYFLLQLLELRLILERIISQKFTM